MYRWGLSMKHEHLCGAEILVLLESAGAASGPDGSAFRMVFRDQDLQELQRCPDCAQSLAQAWQEKELRCVDEIADLA